MSIGKPIIAVIPVKETSERVNNKNFRIFADNYSLLELKIIQLIDSCAFDKIYVSSDSERAREIAELHGVHFIRRNQEFCNNQVPWSDVIVEVVSSLPVDNESSIAWCHTTSPLFDRYKEACEFYRNLGSQYDSIVAVRKFSEFLVTDKGRPYNYNWGVWHEYSQNLQELYSVTGAIFITKKWRILENRYVISRNPSFFVSSPFESVDVDTEYDFCLAQMLYLNRNKFSQLVG